MATKAQVTVLENPCCEAEFVGVDQNTTDYVDLRSDGTFDITDSYEHEIAWDTLYCTGCNNSLYWRKQVDGSYLLTK